MTSDTHGQTCPAGLARPGRSSVRATTSPTGPFCGSERVSPDEGVLSVGSVRETLRRRVTAMAKKKVAKKAAKKKAAKKKK